MSYERYQLQLAPPWLRQKTGRAWLEAHGQQKDALVQLVLEAVIARFIQSAPEDALDSLGRDRGLRRYPDERLEAWRARVLGAWDFWILGGTLAGVELMLETLGYQASVYEHFRSDPTIWSEFTVFLRDENRDFTAAGWGEFAWGATDHFWGSSVRLSETVRVREVVDLVKAAHSKARTIMFIAEGFAWGEPGFTWGQLAWGGRSTTY
jgi:hypothetical protein